MIPDLTIALLQANPYWEDAEANLAMFEEMVWSIDESVDVILLPEMFNTGFSMNPKQLAEVAGLKTQRWMLRMAAQKQTLVGGSYIVQVEEKYFNRFLFAFPDGTMQYYDKRHLFSLAKEEEFFTPGTERLVVDYLGWKICPLVCYDLRFPAWSRNTVHEGQYDYDLLIYAANWPKPRIRAWDILLPARAIENLSYVAGINRVGLDGNDHQYVGHSVVLDYAGGVLSGLDEQEGVIVQKLERKSLEEFRSKFAFLQDADKITFS
ncbi:amidohydrolase [Reichenbachiella agarivorans]|uniref:Amidohydrolase n=1 Tax=Reichenbachiella agarivorans TaxID=2979464 RepID=A0ABY6CTB6_9BACT|nr:amidohydrolase [Reichenbachiella agarivorans]UXP33235.1 amidohydrolase [Reichenbachiella agarivorans]